jgi:hypothetical protein
MKEKDLEFCSRLSNSWWQSGNAPGVYTLKKAAERARYLATATKGIYRVFNNMGYLTNGSKPATLGRGLV